MRERIENGLFPLSLVLLCAGGLSQVAGHEEWARLAWSAGAVAGLLVSIISVLASLREGRTGVDLIAVLALAGSLWTGEAFAGCVLAVMLSSGRVLETRAQARAKRELGLLVERAPKRARRLDGQGGVAEVPVEEVRRGDRLIVGPGEVVPVDVRLLANALLDESMLTGEPLPVERTSGDGARSGSINQGSSFECVATSEAAESTYARLVRLVETARAESAPLVRSADKYAAAFVPFTLVTAGLAWALSGEAVRAVAVLVVATPCPLILAVPIAVMSGLSRVSRLGVVVKGGGALEALAKGRVLLFDKTGTLTAGRPVVAQVVACAQAADCPEWLRLAGSLEQISPHVVAGAIVTAARQREGGLELPSEANELTGRGVEGLVSGRRVRVGKGAWVFGEEWPAWARQVRRRASLDSQITVFVAVDGVPRGALLLEDPIRPDAPRMLRALKQAGIERTVLVTGDRSDVAESVGRIVGVDAVRADQDPMQKVAVVESESHLGPTIMVGDGVNDAPALARANVGVALASRGVSASSETADVVLTQDRIDGLADAILAAKNAQRIANQSVWLGMGLSIGAMGFAAFGLLPPAMGAILQEGIDLAAIASALRALSPGPRHTVSMKPAQLAMARRFDQQHKAAERSIERLRSVADALDPAAFDLAPVQALVAELQEELMPHERAEETQLYPAMQKLMGGPEAVAALSRTHAEIDRQMGLLERLVHDLGTGDVGAEDVVELRRLMYGLYAVLRLHNAQEEENLYSLMESNPAASTKTDRG